MHLHLLSTPGKNDLRYVLEASKPYLEDKDDPLVAYLPLASLYAEKWLGVNESAFRGLAQIREVNAELMTQKEIEEQALVCRYIVDCFKKIRLREYEEHGPKTVMAGSLLHLRTDFRVDMKATGFPQLGSVMLDLLHPTSAVCGMPRKEAHEFLQANEDFDRSFFAGFIGPVNIQEETSIYVNLRTASLKGEHAILYAGAGVTEDSDPEKEWEETELKCQIIGKFIQKPKA